MLHERDLLPALLATLVASPVLAWLTGRLVARHLRAVPGAARRWMPTLPELPKHDGTPAARFDRQVRLAEAKAVQLLLRQPEPMLTGLHAAQLAADVGVPTAVASAVLDDWRHRLPCRVRVTGDGRLLHDFDREAIAGAVRSAWHSAPQRLLLWLGALLANLGALWWVVAGALVGVTSLTEVLQAADEEAMVVSALTGVVMVLAVFGLSQLGAWLVRVLTWRRFPKMAAARVAMVARPGRSKRPAKAKHTPKPDDAPSTGGSLALDGLSAVGDVDGDGCLFVIGAAAVAFLATAVLGGLAVVGLWLRGIWRVVQRLGEPERDQSPASWLQDAQPLPVWERWVPTNDLAVRLVRALGRLLQLRPADDQLAGLVLALARNQNGRVAALDIALHTGLDLPEAMSVGTRLIQRLGGDLAVSERGDVDFCLPDEAWSGHKAEPQPLPYEYLDAPTAQLARLEQLAVNVPGLHRDHLAGASRLAGGPLATVAVLAAVAAGVADDVPVKGLELSFAALFCVLTPGTLMLAAAARQAVAEAALQGVLRDVRRHTVAAVRTALRGGPPELDASALADQLTRAIVPLRPGWPPGSVLREVEATLADLGLEPDLRRGGSGWALEPLRRRQGALVALRAAEPRARRLANADEVVFDSGVVG